jgi:cytosine/uracil/thiamine/allantoin permease
MNLWPQASRQADRQARVLANAMRFPPLELHACKGAGLMWATLTTNIAANIVAPANAFVNIAPRVIGFNAGALLTAALGVVIMPWRLVRWVAGQMCYNVLGPSSVGDIEYK